MTTFLREGIEATLREPDQPGAASSTAPAVIDLKGDLATLTEARLREAFSRAVEGGAEEVRLLFGGVEHINSSGIPVLIDFLRECQEHGRRLSFSGLTAHYQKVFTFMGLTLYAPIVGDANSDGPAASRRATPAMVEGVARGNGALGGAQ